jgi:DNA-binding MarR family transcriptional regulator
MDRPLPLSTLLSFALVAFTIEFDNEVEHQLPYRTSDGGGAASDPWLISMAMYFNFLQFVPEQGIAVRELERRIPTRPNWDGMRRWGYVFFAPDPGDLRPRPPQTEWLVRTTPQGHVFQEGMRRLLPEIEQRWSERFGDPTIEKLRRGLIALLRTLPGGLPDCMPILHYGLMSEGPAERGDSASESECGELPLPVLLARVLLGLTLEFEQDAQMSLAICSNIFRVLDTDGTLVRHIPALSGVSKDAIAMALGFLNKRGFIEVVSQEQARRGRLVLLTSAGIRMQSDYPLRLRIAEERCKARMGPEASSALRGALEGLGGDGTRNGSLLFQGLDPWPGSWRSKIKPPATLPHFPMVLHRGGFPDGS